MITTVQIYSSCGLKSPKTAMFSGASWMEPNNFMHMDSTCGGRGCSQLLLNPQLDGLPAVTCR